MRCLLLLIGIVISLSCFAQNSDLNTIDSLAGHLVKNINASNKERIILQTNKRIFSTGETIWFKAYAIDSLRGKLTNKSKIIMVDLVDEKDSIVQQVFLHGNNLKTEGSIALNDTSLVGYYYLRGYTKTLIAENPDNIGVLPIYIFNSKLKHSLQDPNLKDATSLTAEIKPVINIYPEGGALISGTNSVVAITAHDKNGNPLVVSGIVKDNRDTVVAKFSTNNNGLGKFSFSPAWFGKYKVYVQNKNEFEYVTMLPPVDQFAEQISVIEQNDQNAKIRVMLEDSVYRKDYTTYILAVSKDSVCFASVGRGMYELNIPLSNFPVGIAHIILFSEDKKPVSERSIYISKKNADVEIAANKQNYGARENVQLNITVKDAFGKPIVAALSVAVNDARIPDITNELSGDTLSHYSAEDADLFMLTQTPFINNIMSNRASNIYGSKNEDDTFSIKGKVMAQNRMPVPNQTVTLMSSGEQNFLILQDTTNEQGEFNFLMPDYDNGTRFELQVANHKGIKQDYTIDVDTTTTFHFSTREKIKVNMNKEKAELIKAITQVDDVLINNEKGSLPPVKVTTKLSDNNDGSINNNIITGKSLRDKHISNAGDAILRSGKFHLVGGFLMSGGPNGTSGASSTDEPMVVINGVRSILSTGDISELSPVLSFLKSIPTENIDYIKILIGGGAAMYGMSSGHDVIEIVTTSKIDNNDISGIKTIYPRGFYVPVAFDMPDYNKKEQKSSKNPDRRISIYWNGTIITDNNGKAIVNFFTADSPATYRITVSGITANGDKVYKTMMIERR